MAPAWLNARLAERDGYFAPTGDGHFYFLALIEATKHPQIHGHPTICQTAAQIVPVLTKEMMATGG